MSSTEITCAPPAAILNLSAETIAALDRLGETLPAGTPWQIDVAVGWSAADTIHLTAKPATTEKDAA